MVSLEILRQLKLTSYKRYVDDKERRTAMMINCHDDIHDKLNSYHLNIKLTVENNPIKFFDTAVPPVPWDSNTSKRYKRNIIYTVLHRELILTKRKFIAANYVIKFIERVIT